MACTSGGSRRTRVKTGCRTCKIRKVKCDEGRPACKRCTSTGRKCDGYGIWGGGGEPANDPKPKATPTDLILSRSPRSYPVFSPSNQDDMEMRAFEWFSTRTATKLPGSYFSTFWGSLLFQAILGEKAVWHAALALGSFHRTRIILIEDCEANAVDYLPAKEGKFMLQHYVTAIGHLRESLSTRDKSSYRIALIICVLFTSLDFLRGHLGAAQMHLQNGLKILSELQSISLGNKQTSQCLTHCLDPEDRWIAEAYSRLHFQIHLMKPVREKGFFSFPRTEIDTSTAGFQSLAEAWQQWERIVNRIFAIAEKARSQGTTDDLTEQRQQVQSDLDRWVIRHQHTKFELPSEDIEKAKWLLISHHRMAVIMAESCLHPGDEMIYDSLTGHFILLLTYLIKLRKAASGIHPLLNSFKWPKMMMAWCIVDMGGIMPLYYVATKCRVRRIRLQAIHMLGSSSHREGIWDSLTSARVTRKVMELEEQDTSQETVQDFPVLAYPQPWKVGQPSVPASRRICDVEMELEGAPMDTISLFGYKDFKRVLLSKYDVRLMKWRDTRHASEPFIGEGEEKEEGLGLDDS